MNNEIIEMEGSASRDVVQQTITPMSIIQQAVSQGAKVEELTQLMALQERYEANEARKAFTVAMGNFKAANITVVKNAKVAFGNTKYKHATLNNVVDTLSEELTKHGLSFTWKTEQGDQGKMKVTCILKHILGHSESSSMEAMPDTSGQKNSIQAIGSVVTYLQRYTALAVTGTATADMDDDGKSVFDDTLLQSHIQAIKSANTKAELLAAFLASVEASAGDKKAYNILAKAKDAQISLLSSPKDKP